MAGRKYTISVKTQIPELREQCGFANKVLVDGNKTWNQVLSEHIELPVDPHKHYIKSANGKAIAKLGARVEDFMTNFKQVRQQYIVHLHPREHSRKYPQSQCGSPRRRAKNPLLHTKKRLPKKIVVPIPGVGTSNNSPTNNMRPPIKTGRRYEEDDMEIPNVPIANFNNFKPGPLVNNNQRLDDSFDDEEFDDAMSQDSQDSEEDVKAQVVDKIMKQLSNGHINRMKKELGKLSGSRLLSASKYLPFTIQALQIIFQDQD